jgi:hypothetical protein
MVIQYMMWALGCLPKPVVQYRIWGDDVTHSQRSRLLRNLLATIFSSLDQGRL